MVYGPFDRAVRYPVWFGIVLLCTGFTMHYLGVQAVRDLGMVDAALLEPTPVVLDLQPDPATPELFGAGLFVGALRAVYATVSTFGLLVSAVGALSVVVGLVLVRRRLVVRTARALGESLSDLRTVTALAGLIAFVFALVASPPFRGLVTNLFTFALASVPVFVLASLSVLRLERRAGPVATVFLVGPLTVGAVLLSVIAGAFASPATVVFMQRLTAGLVRFLLVDVLSTVGLDRPLVRVFELEGVGFLAFWIGIDVVVGVAFGLANLRYRTVSVESAARRARGVVTDRSDGESRR